MNAIVEINCGLQETHRDAVSDFNRWRGRCLDCFAKIEDQTVETLLAMVSVAEVNTIRLPALYGQRIEELRRTISPEGPYHGLGKGVGKTLEEIDRWLPYRNIVVHGVGSIWIDCSAAWLWRYRFRSNNKGSSLHEGVLTSAFAREMEKGLASRSRSLCDRLNNLAKNLA